MLAKPIGRFLANQLLEPLPQSFPKTPSDYGLTYRDVEFPTRDGITLRGWLVNETAKKAVIITHFGLRATRYGYQPDIQPRLTKPFDKEIEFGLIAKRLVEAGYGVLMYDLRNHGESDCTKLGVGTGGTGERFDVIAAVECVAKEMAGAPIGLLSFCYGANTSFFAMQEDPEVFAECNVKAMIAANPLTNADAARSLKLPNFIFRAANTAFEARSGAKFDAPIVEAAASVCVPTRVVQGRKDGMANYDKVAGVLDAIPTEKEMLFLDNPAHRFDAYGWFADHPRDMLDWFDKFV